MKLSLNRILTYLCMASLGVAHAQTFSSWPSGGIQILILSLVWAWLAVAPVSYKPVRQMFVFALAWFCSGTYWLHFSMHGIGGLPTWMSVIAVIGLSAYLASFSTLMAWLWRRYFTGQKLSDFMVVMPALWLGAELARGYLLGGIPNMLVGYAQVDNVLLKGWFAVLGVYGVGALAAVLSGVLAWFWVSLHRRVLTAQSRAWVMIGVSVHTLGAVGLVLQGVNWGSAVGAPVRMRVVQPNVAQTIKFDKDEILRNTNFALKTAIDSTAQVTVFPETMMPYPWQQAPEAGLHALQQAMKSSASPRAALIGSVGSSRSGSASEPTYYNSAIWVDGSGDVLNPTRYDKIHLMPFGETIPVGFQWFVKAMDIPLGGYGVGQSRTPFSLKTPTGAVRIASNICYENVFGEELAQWHADDTHAPNIWVNLTNLAWFGDARTSAVFSQFVQMSRARAMELARPMLNVANTGDTVSILPDGQFAQRLPAQQLASAEWQVQPYQGKTLYVAWGNAPMWVVLCIFGAWLIREKTKAKAKVDFEP